MYKKHRPCRKKSFRFTRTTEDELCSCQRGVLIVWSERLIPKVKKGRKCVELWTKEIEELRRVMRRKRRSWIRHRVEDDRKLFVEVCGEQEEVLSGDTEGEKKSMAGQNKGD